MSRRRGEPLGAYARQAAIAACHARAPTAARTDWRGIAALSDALAQARPSPVVELNRAVAVSMAFGPAVGLEIIEQLAAEKSLQNYQWLPGVRSDLLARLGRTEEAVCCSSTLQRWFSTCVSGSFCSAGRVRCKTRLILKYFDEKCC